MSFYPPSEDSDSYFPLCSNALGLSSSCEDEESILASSLSPSTGSSFDSDDVSKVSTPDAHAITLANAMDDAVCTLNTQWEESRIEDLLACIDRMHNLMRNLTENAKFRPIIDDGQGDVPLWNKTIAMYFHDKDFMSSPSVFTEAYTYRRLQECFSISKYWKDYDVFFRAKCDSFARSEHAILELSKRFSDGFGKGYEKARMKVLFLELAQGPKSPTTTNQKHILRAWQSTRLSHQQEKDISLVALWDKITSPRLKGRPVDVKLSEAGFELFRDCIFADYLIQSGLASAVHFHGGAPCSGAVTRKDWDWLLNRMMYGRGGGRGWGVEGEWEQEVLRKMGKRWRGYVNVGTWVYEPQHLASASAWEFQGGASPPISFPTEFDPPVLALRDDILPPASRLILTKREHHRNAY